MFYDVQIKVSWDLLFTFRFI